MMVDRPYNRLRRPTLTEWLATGTIVVGTLSFCVLVLAWTARLFYHLWLKGTP